MLLKYEPRESSGSTVNIGEKGGCHTLTKGTAGRQSHGSLTMQPELCHAAIDRTAESQRASRNPQPYPKVFHTLLSNVDKSCSQKRSRCEDLSY